MSDRFEFNPNVFHCMTRFLMSLWLSFSICKLGMESALWESVWVKCNEAHKSLSIMISMLQKQKKTLAMISFFNRVLWNKGTWFCLVVFLKKKKTKKHKTREAEFWLCGLSPAWSLGEEGSVADHTTSTCRGMKGNVYNQRSRWLGDRGQQGTLSTQKVQAPTILLSIGDFPSSPWPCF